VVVQSVPLTSSIAPPRPKPDRLLTFSPVGNPGWSSCRVMPQAPRPAQSKRLGPPGPSALGRVWLMPLGGGRAGSSGGVESPPLLPFARIETPSSYGSANLIARPDRRAGSGAGAQPEVAEGSLFRIRNDGSFGILGSLPPRRLLLGLGARRRSGSFPMSSRRMGALGVDLGGSGEEAEPEMGGFGRSWMPSRRNRPDQKASAAPSPPRLARIWHLTRAPRAAIISASRLAGDQMSCAHGISHQSRLCSRL
jgi:hypothetical protein